uniref:Ribonuclease A-domain domain-containing protein n=1 Tax=Oreochromis niloticus TaxID=8128 RepID=A0A669B7R2_ORENI
TDTDSFPVNPDECSRIIKERNIRENGECKKINTFLLATGRSVRNICAHGDGIKSARLYVVVCKQVTSSRRRCTYSGQGPDYRNVDIKCEGGVPVHLASV